VTLDRVAPRREYVASTNVDAYRKASLSQAAVPVVALPQELVPLFRQPLGVGLGVSNMLKSGHGLCGAQPFNPRTREQLNERRRSLMAEPLLEARNIGRRFGHVEALSDVDFTVYPNEIVGLIGDNGAGKSTLTKILSGADEPSEGEIRVEGQVVRLTSPHVARDHGIETVYQDLALAPELDPAANFFLGRELTRPGLLGRLGVLDRTAMARRTVSEIVRLGVTLKDAAAPIVELSGGQRQSVAVARAAMWAKKVIFLDEPTAALGVVQTHGVVDLIRRVRDDGIAVVLISHNMQQVLDVCDRIEVLRLGRSIGHVPARGTTVEDLVTAMTGGGIKEQQ